MSRRKKHKEHVNHERWLVSYADFITLLFAFFVVLYASAQVDNKKVVQISAAIQGGFQQMGVFSGAGDGSGKPGGSSALAPNSASIPKLARLVNDLSKQGPVHGEPRLPLSSVKKELENSLGDEIRKHQVNLRVVPDGLVVSLSEVGFFNTGEAQLLPEAEPVLTHIAQVLAEGGFQIRVEGHTDNVPIHNAHYDSNWELSTARATSVVVMMVQKCGFEPNHLSVAGYAQYHPLEGNDSDEGRRKNRRVDLVIVALPADEDPPVRTTQAAHKPVLRPASVRRKSN
jgi:chemotaxis protein MotB